MPDESSSAAPARKTRLAPADRSKDLLPWRRAENMAKCFLYWMPVSAFPAPESEKAWLLRFTTLLGARLKKEADADPWIFLQYKTANAVHDEFVRRSREFMPLMGLGRRPGVQMPNLPSDKELQDAIDQKRRLDLNKHTPDYAYWFLTKSDLPQRKVFQGLGGMTILYRKSDPKAKPPELTIPPQYQEHQLFKTFDVHGLLAGACSMQDEFLKKSKIAFGAGLETNVQVEFLPFILPLLGTADFFRLQEEQMKAHFDLFEVYVQESPVDQGMVVASKLNLDEILIDILREIESSPGVSR
jgi:hypothetical protein